MGKEKQAAKRPLRTRRERLQASAIVQYEMAMFGGTHKWLWVMVQSENHEKSDITYNTFIHAFLVAARNLTVFLFSHNPRPSDIIAEDFFDEPVVWTHIRQDIAADAPSLNDGSFVNLISKRLAHLTWDRIGGNAPKYGPFPIAFNITSGMLRFIDAVDDRYLIPELERDVRQVMVELRRELQENGRTEADLRGMTDLANSNPYTRGV